jgi:ComF family protein
MVDAVLGLAELVFPPRCVGCAQMLPPGRLTCAVCATAVDRVEDQPHCPRCLDLVGPGTCPRCASRPPPFEEVRAGLVYGGTVTDAVHRLKFGGSPWVAAELADVAFPSVSWASGIELLVPVPLHPSRHRERGYNQAALVARALGGRAGLPVAPHGLERVKATVPAATLSPEEREAAVSHAFAVREPGTVRGRRVGLVDDVVTTTATVRAAARVLVDAGATVVVVALARGGSGAEP